MENGNGESNEIAPSIDAMIDASSSSDSSSGPTVLEEITFTIEDATAPSSEQPAKRGRGRPRKDGSAPASGTTTPDAKQPAKKKAELATEVERLQGELATLRARNDESKISELAKSIEMASYLGFGWAGEIRGPHWGIKEDEAKDLGHAGAVALAPYSEQIVEKLPWMVFAGTLGKILYERIKIDRQMVAALEAQGVR